MNEKIQVGRSKKQRGHSILKCQYEQLAEFILRQLYQNENITLIQLIEHAQHELSVDFRGDIHWSLLTVKHDLEQKGEITIMKNPGRSQLIKLNKRKSRLQLAVKS